MQKKESKVNCKNILHLLKGQTSAVLPDVLLWQNKIINKVWQWQESAFNVHSV